MFKERQEEGGVGEKEEGKGHRCHIYVYGQKTRVTRWWKANA